MRENRRKIAQHVQCLRGVHETLAGAGIRGGAGEHGGVAGGNRSRSRRNGRGPEAVEHGIQQALADGFGEDVGDAVKKGFLFPVGLGGFGEGDDGRFLVAATEAFNAPDAFHAHHVRVENARSGQPVNHQRFGLVHVDAMDDAVLFGIQADPNGLGEVGMRGQNQYRLHRLPG